MADERSKTPAISPIFNKEDFDQLRPFKTQEALDKARALIVEQKKLIDSAKSDLDAVIESRLKKGAPQPVPRPPIIAKIQSILPFGLTKKREPTPEEKAHDVYNKKVADIVADTKLKLGKIAELQHAPKLTPIFNRAANPWGPGGGHSPNGPNHNGPGNDGGPTGPGKLPQPPQPPMKRGELTSTFNKAGPVQQAGKAAEAFRSAAISDRSLGEPARGRENDAGAAKVTDAEKPPMQNASVALPSEKVPNWTKAQQQRLAALAPQQVAERSPANQNSRQGKAGDAEATSAAPDTQVPPSQSASVALPGERVPNWTEAQRAQMAAYEARQAAERAVTHDDQGLSRERQI